MSILEEINKGKDVLSKGEVLLYPTDTIWGIGCDATNEQAVSRISQLKNRESGDGFVVLFSSVDMLEAFSDDVDADVVSLLSAERPTTVIMHGLISLAIGAMGPENTIAVRIPKDEFCAHLIEGLGKPIISTSANLSGEDAPQSYGEISESILSAVDYAIDLRRDDKMGAKPSRIIKLLGSGGFEVIRE